MKENTAAKLNFKEGPNGPLYTLAEKYLEISGVSSETIEDIFWRAENDPTLWVSEYLDPTGEHDGMATMDAIRCLIDTHRTNILVQGIRESVESLKAKNTGKIIGIDAGTGTGILAMTLIQAGCDEVYALEINKETSEVTQKFIQELGYEGKIKIINCDATNVAIPELVDTPAQILVSENLSAGLFDEPQFKIIKHLSQYLAQGAEIIPFKATNVIGVGHGAWDKMGDESVVNVRRLQDFTRQEGSHLLSDIFSTRDMEIPFIKGSISFPLKGDQDVNTLLISSRFQINDLNEGGILLEDSARFLGESHAIRLPQPIKSTENQIFIDISYLAGKRVDQTQIQVQNNRIILS